MFFDEIQNVDGWERFVNSHSQDFVEESELFISGSNSKMLSSELATLLSGRYVEFHIFPYSYAEYLQLMQHLPVGLLIWPIYRKAVCPNCTTCPLSSQKNSTSLL